MTYTVYAWSVGSRLQYLFETDNLSDIWEFRRENVGHIIVKAHVRGDIPEQWLKLESFWHRDHERCALRELKGDELEELGEAIRDYEEHVISIPG